jgi:hypothetical protein
VAAQSAVKARLAKVPAVIVPSAFVAFEKFFAALMGGALEK